MVNFSLHQIIHAATLAWMFHIHIGIVLSLQYIYIKMAFESEAKGEGGKGNIVPLTEIGNCRSK